LNPSPEHFLHGERGARVVPTPQRAINVLASSGVLKQIRSLIGAGDPVLDAWAAALVMASLEARHASEVRSTRAPTSEPVASSVRRLTTKQAADQLNKTTRAVTEACVAGRLAAHKDEDGRWRITPAALNAYRALDRSA
jgi:hypothetical protein